MDFEKAQNYGKQLINEVNKASRHFKQWEDKFICRELADYYEGFQWEDDSVHHYTLNMFFATYQVKRPTLLFKKPQFYASPKPGKADFDLNKANSTAQLASDTLNTLVMSDKMRFAEEAESCILDAGSHFGIMEVGFDATWVANPKAAKPILKSEMDSTEGDVDDEIEVEPPEIPQEEWIYVKRIDPRRFRVSLPDFKNLEHHKWCGYYEYIRYEDLKDKRIPFQHIEKIMPGTHVATSGLPVETVSEDEMYSGYNKIWKIWHNFEKKLYMIDDLTNTIIYEANFTRLPLFPLKFHNRRNGFYPIPYFFNWKSPQDDINEIRDGLRYIRRRAKRIWASRRGTLDIDELDKMLTGPSEQVIEVDGDPNTSLVPVASPPVDSAIINAFTVSKDDFNIVSSTSAETRGEADRVTATQANLMASRSTIREADEKEIIAKWYCEIGKEILSVAAERMTLPLWIKINSDVGAFGQDVQDIQQKWTQVEAGQFASLDFDLNFSVESISPVARDEEKAAYLEFLAVINQYPMLSLNPDLIRETAFRLNYRNEKVIQAMQQAAILHIMSQMAGAQQEGAGQTNMSQKTVEQMQPPDQAQIENQIANQGVPMQ